jgi:hypothetical protein
MTPIPYYTQRRCLNEGPARHRLNVTQDAVVVRRVVAGIDDTVSIFQFLGDVHCALHAIEGILSALAALDRKPKDGTVNAELNCHFFADADVLRLTNSLFLARDTIAGCAGKLRGASPDDFAAVAVREVFHRPEF